jgi:hypothetical protein
LRKIFLSLPFVLPAPWFNCLWFIIITITSTKHILYWFVTFRNKLINFFRILAFRPSILFILLLFLLLFYVLLYVLLILLCTFRFLCICTLLCFVLCWIYNWHLWCCSSRTSINTYWNELNIFIIPFYYYHHHHHHHHHSHHLHLQ